MSASQARIERGLAAPPLPPVARTQTIEEALAWHHVPGASVCVFRAGRIEWAAGYGVCEVGTARPVGERTIFQSCSISKPVAAMAALRLVREGALDLDADVNESLRSWKVPANAGWQPRVKLRHLLTHSAGFSYCWYPGYLRGTPTPTLLQTLGGEPPANTPPVIVTAVPGTAFRYAGGHFSVLQQLLEDVTGQPFPALMCELVLDPLGMDCTSYDQRFPETHGDVAAGHNVVGEVIEGRWRALPEMAAAGMWTTPSDLARVALDLQAAWSGRGGLLLDQQTAQATLTPGLGDRGLGWVVYNWGVRRHFGHGGSNIGYQCRVVCDAERGNGIAVMTNGDDGWQVHHAIVQAAAREYGWDAPLEDGDSFGLPVASTSGTADAACAGEYITEDATVFAVAAVAGGLEARFAGQPPISLLPLGELTYAATVVNLRLAFARDDDGAIAGCTVYQNEATLIAERTAG